MLRDPSECGSSLIQEIKERVRTTTHGRIRHLEVEEVQGTVVVRGSVPSQHMKQMALHAALELVSADRVRPCITVG